MIKGIATEFRVKVEIDSDGKYCFVSDEIKVIASKSKYYIVEHRCSTAVDATLYIQHKDGTSSELFTYTALDIRDAVLIAFRFYSNYEHSLKKN